MKIYEKNLLSARMSCYKDQKIEVSAYNFKTNDGTLSINLRTKKKETTWMEKKEEVNSLIGKAIIESMTQGQLAFLINSLLSLLDDKKKKHLLTVLDKEIADTLSQILDPSDKSSKHTATDSKYQEDWRKLWDKWYNFSSG